MEVVERPSGLNVAPNGKIETIAKWFKEHNLEKLNDNEIRGKLGELTFPNERGVGRKTLLHLLAKINKKGIGRVIDIAINESKLRVNALDILFNTPAHVALVAENEEAFVALKMNGANLQRKNMIDETPEEMAGRNGKLAMVELARSEPSLELMQIVRPIFPNKV